MITQIVINTVATANIASILNAIIIFKIDKLLTMYKHNKNNCQE